MSDFKQIQTEIEKEVDNKVQDDMNSFYKDFQKFFKESSEKYPHLNNLPNIEMHFKWVNRGDAKITHIGDIKFNRNYSTLDYSSNFVSFFSKKLKLHYLRTYLSGLRKTLWQ